MTINPDGSDEHLLADDFRYQFPAWSPTTNDVAAIGFRRRQAGVYVFEDQTENGGPVFESNSQSPIYLYWTPDGEDVSFIASNGAGLSLYLVPKGEKMMVKN